jgi:hypothetical protein
MLRVLLVTAALILGLSATAKAWEDESFDTFSSSYGSNGGYGGYSRSFSFPQRRVFRQEQIIENQVVQEPDQVITRNRVVFRPQVVQEQQVIPGRRYVVPRIRQQNFESFDEGVEEFDSCPPPVQRRFYAPPSRCGSAYAQGFEVRNGGCDSAFQAGQLAALQSLRGRGGYNSFGASRGGGGLLGGILGGGSRGGGGLLGLGLLSGGGGEREIDFRADRVEGLEFATADRRPGLLGRILGR